MTQLCLRNLKNKNDENYVILLKEMNNASSLIFMYRLKKVRKRNSLQNNKPHCLLLSGHSGILKGNSGQSRNDVESNKFCPLSYVF